MDSYTASLMEQFVACAPPAVVPAIKELPPLPPELIRQELPIPSSENQSEAI